MGTLIRREPLVIVAVIVAIVSVAVTGGDVEPIVAALVVGGLARPLVSPAERR